MTSEQNKPAVLGPVQRQVRPACWKLAMDFLGEPEAPIVEAYVLALEAENQRLLSEVARLLPLTTCGCGTAFELDYRGECVNCAKSWGSDY